MPPAPRSSQSTQSCFGTSTPSMTLEAGQAVALSALEPVLHLVPQAFRGSGEPSLDVVGARLAAAAFPEGLAAQEGTQGGHQGVPLESPAAWSSLAMVSQLQLDFQKESQHRASFERSRRRSSVSTAACLASRLEP